jgi:hypothetical protein
MYTIILTSNKTNSKVYVSNYNHFTREVEYIRVKKLLFHTFYDVPCATTIFNVKPTEFYNKIDKEFIKNKFDIDDEKSKVLFSDGEYVDAANSCMIKSQSIKMYRSKITHKDYKVIPGYVTATGYNLSDVDYKMPEKKWYYNNMIFDFRNFKVHVKEAKYDIYEVSFKNISKSYMHASFDTYDSRYETETEHTKLYDYEIVDSLELYGLRNIKIKVEWKNGYNMKFTSYHNPITLL